MNCVQMCSSDVGRNFVGYAFEIESPAAAALSHKVIRLCSTHALNEPSKAAGNKFLASDERANDPFPTANVSLSAYSETVWYL